MRTGAHSTPKQGGYANLFGKPAAEGYANPGTDEISGGYAPSGQPIALYFKILKIRSLILVVTS